MTATAISVEATPLNFEGNETRLTERTAPDRDKTRYVACIGNHLETTDAIQFNSVGGWAGGVWVGHSEIEGAPTMKRTHHMILRGLFTPLETRAVSKKADHRESEGYRETYLDGPGVPAFTRGYTVYAGDDLAYLQSERYRPMGVVEITPLFGVDWNAELRKSLQDFFFPQWAQWQSGEGTVPVLLDDWVGLVQEARRKAQYENHILISEQLSESARLFRIYANNQIERNRQAIQSMRSADHGGQYVGWHNKCRMYAEQLGIVLEDEKTLAPVTSGNNDAIVLEMREERKLREKELEAQREYNQALMTKLGVEIPKPVVNEVAPPPAPVLTEERIAEEAVSFGYEDVAPDMSEPPMLMEEEINLAPTGEVDVTPGCSEFNTKGEPCRAKVHAGNTLCTFHSKMKEAEGN